MPDPTPTAPRATGLGARCRAWSGALRARWDHHLAVRRERQSLQALGAALAGAPGGVSAGGERVRAALAAVAERDRHLDALRAALGTSLDQDRADYAAVSAWMRPVVILRGVADRCVVRDRARLARRARTAACGALGAAALDEGLDAPAGAEPSSAAAAEARARAAAAGAALQERLAALETAPVPAIARHAAREAVALGKPIASELRGRFFPRLPALAGLVVGWWIAQTFTDSRFSATLHALGIGSGPRHAVSSGQLQAMQFWLPLLAAAICSYASGRLAALVRARYAPPAAPPAAASQETPAARDEPPGQAGAGGR